MPTKNFSLKNVSLLSTWSCYSENGAYTRHTTPTTVKSVQTVVIEGLPAGAKVTSATLSGTAGSPLSGVALSTINGESTGMGRDFSIAVDIIDNNRIDFTFAFKANGTGHGHATSPYTHQSAMNYTNMVLTVAYDEGSEADRYGWTCSPSVEAGNNVTVTLETVLTGYTYEYQVAFGNNISTWQSVDVNTHMSNYLIPLEWLSAIPDAVSGTASVTMRKVNDEGAMTTEQLSFTICCPESVVPITGVPIITVINGQNGLCLSEVSWARVEAQESQGAYGSTIVNTEISGGGYIANDTTLVTKTFSIAQTVVFTVKVTDSRGHIGINTAQIEVVGYERPQILSITQERYPDYTSSSIRVSVGYQWTSFPGNNIVLRIDCSADDGYTWITSVQSDSSPISGAYQILNIVADQEKSYKLRYTLSDNVDNTVIESSVGSGYVFAIWDNVTRTISFGGYPEKDTDCFSVAGNWNFYTHGKEIMELLEETKLSACADSLVVIKELNARMLAVEGFIKDFNPDAGGTGETGSLEQLLGAMDERIASTELAINSLLSEISLKADKTDLQDFVAIDELETKTLEIINGTRLNSVLANTITADSLSVDGNILAGDIYATCVGSSEGQIDMLSSTVAQTESLWATAAFVEALVLSGSMVSSGSQTVVTSLNGLDKTYADLRYIDVDGNEQTVRVLTDVESRGPNQATLKYLTTE